MRVYCSICTLGSCTSLVFSFVDFIFFIFTLFFLFEIHTWIDFHFASMLIIIAYECAFGWDFFRTSSLFYFTCIFIVLFYFSRSFYFFCFFFSFCKSTFVLSSSLRNADFKLLKKTFQGIANKSKRKCKNSSIWNRYTNYSYSFTNESVYCTRLFSVFFFVRF